MKLFFDIATFLNLLNSSDFFDIHRHFSTSILQQFRIFFFVLSTTSKTFETVLKSSTHQTKNILKNNFHFHSNFDVFKSLCDSIFRSQQKEKTTKTILGEIYWNFSGRYFYSDGMTCFSMEFKIDFF